jgi:hypothetical protein
MIINVTSALLKGIEVRILSLLNDSVVTWGMPDLTVFAPKCDRIMLTWFSHYLKELDSAVYHVSCSR